MCRNIPFSHLLPKVAPPEYQVEERRRDDHRGQECVPERGVEDVDVGGPGGGLLRQLHEQLGVLLVDAEGEVYDLQEEEGGEMKCSTCAESFAKL